MGGYGAHEVDKTKSKRPGAPPSIFYPMPILNPLRLKQLRFVFLAAAILLLTGCSRSTVSTRFNTPEFTVANLQTASSVLLISPDVHVHGFKKTYRALFKDTAALSTRISRKILDSLQLGAPVISASGKADSALKIRLDETGAKYVIYLHTVTIEDTVELKEDLLLPGVNGLQPSRGGISKSCLVTFDVDILDRALAKQYSFRVHTKTDVLLYAYKTALLTSLDAAARKTVVHLEGR